MKITPPCRRLVAVLVISLLPTFATAEDVSPSREIVSDGIDRIEQASVLPMLTQRVAAVTCAMATGINEDETYHRFEQIVIALRDGAPSVGIQPAPTDEIRADLDDLIARWDQIKPLPENLLVDDNVPVETRQTIFDGLEEELAHLDLLVLHDREYTERNH